MQQDATSQVFGLSVGRFSKVIKSRQWMLEWGGTLEWGGMHTSAYDELPPSLVTRRWKWLANLR
ncbi:hypothetical protein PLUA15_110001 [Pseudomonas lundensis]|uniref:Uncharacterized protein n=1 Tax=Pseudomonas lundensis TaxID=86185 RepID=A0AAX2H1T7_9PSED|nr:hypothetical protein PLUA15_110001 [Pseudomonas lundensis]